MTESCDFVLRYSLSGQYPAAFDIIYMPKLVAKYLM